MFWSSTPQQLQRKHANSTLGSHQTSTELFLQNFLFVVLLSSPLLCPHSGCHCSSPSPSLSTVPLLSQETTAIMAKAIKHSGKVTPCTHLTKLQSRGAAGHQGFHFTPCPKYGQLRHPFLLPFPSSCTLH